MCFAHRPIFVTVGIFLGSKGSTHFPSNRGLGNLPAPHASYRIPTITNRRVLSNAGRAHRLSQAHSSSPTQWRQSQVYRGWLSSAIRPLWVRTASCVGLLRSAMYCRARQLSGGSLQQLTQMQPPSAHPHPAHVGVGAAFVAVAEQRRRPEVAILRRQKLNSPHSPATIK